MIRLPLHFLARDKRPHSLGPPQCVQKDGCKEQDFFARHFHPKYDDKKSGPIVSGPFGCIASVDSDNFKVEAELIHNLYLPSAPSPNPIFTQAHLNSLSLSSSAPGQH